MLDPAVLRKYNWKWVYLTLILVATHGKGLASIPAPSFTHFELAKGWNLVSFPSPWTTTEAEALDLDTLEIWVPVPTSTVGTHSPEHPLSATPTSTRIRASDIIPLKPYWVFSEEPLTREIPSETHATPPLFNRGWNLASFTRWVRWETPEPDSVVAWDAVRQTYHTIKLGSLLRPGLGYWLHFDTQPPSSMSSCIPAISSLDAAQQMIHTCIFAGDEVAPRSEFATPRQALNAHALVQAFQDRFFNGENTTPLAHSGSGNMPTGAPVLRLAFSRTSSASNAGVLLVGGEIDDADFLGLYLNGIQMTKNTGPFVYRVALRQGKNRLSFLATDQAGHETPGPSGSDRSRQRARR